MPNTKHLPFVVLGLWLTIAPLARGGTYEDLLKFASTQVQQQQFGDAVDTLKVAIRLAPSRHEGFGMLGLLLHGAQLPKEAQEAVIEALKRVPPAERAKLDGIVAKVFPNGAPAVASLVPGGGQVADSPAKAMTTPPAAAPATPANTLSPEARRKLDLLAVIAEEADKAQRLEERQKALREYLDKSEDFLTSNPEQAGVWAVRAAAALELNKFKTAWEAGRKLVALGAETSDNPKTRKVLALLNRKGLLTVTEPIIGPMAGRNYENSLGMKFVPVVGTDVLFCIWHTRVQDYEAFANETKRSWEKPRFAQTPQHPAVNVSWEDAKAFCAWLTAKEQADGTLLTAQSYRLPQDWEWSVAVGLNEAREAKPKEKDGKLKDEYPWGTQWPPPRGAGNYAPSLNVDDYEHTSPVGSFAANQFGLHDMGGNAWQWCEDPYSGDTTRVLRGASIFGDDSGSLLSTRRSNLEPGERGNNVGFRLVLVGSATR